MGLFVPMCIRCWVQSDCTEGEKSCQDSSLHLRAITGGRTQPSTSNTPESWENKYWNSDWESGSSTTESDILHPLYYLNPLTVYNKVILFGNSHCRILGTFLKRRVSGITLAPPLFQILSYNWYPSSPSCIINSRFPSLSSTTSAHLGSSSGVEVAHTHIPDGFEQWLTLFF